MYWLSALAMGSRAGNGLVIGISYNQSKSYCRSHVEHKTVVLLHFHLHTPSNKCLILIFCTFVGAFVLLLQAALELL